MPSLLTIRRNIAIGLRLIEEPELDRLAENSSNLIVQNCDRHRPVIDSWKQSVSIHERRRWHFKIETAIGGGNTVVRGAPIRHKNAVESPLLLKNFIVQMAVLGHVSAVDQVVGIHDRTHMRFLDGRFKCRQIDFAQCSFINVRT